MTAQNDKRSEATRWVEGHLGTGIDLLEQLVGISSYTLELRGVEEMQDLLAARYRALGLSVEMLPQRGRAPLLVARTANAANEGRDIILSGHADTVHLPDSLPLLLEVSGERLIGPGACDMKAGLVVIDLALSALAHVGVLADLPLRIIINPAEEDPTPELQASVRAAAQGAREALVFEFGRPDGNLVLERKGLATYVIRVTGKSAHSGLHFTEGISAAQQMAHTVLAIAELTNLSRDVTCNVGLVEAGTAMNVVPDAASIGFEVRFARMEDYRILSEHLEALCEPKVPGTTLDLERQHFIPPMEKTAESDALFQRYRSAALRVGLDYGTTPRAGGASDGNLISASGIPTIDGLGPLGGGPHTADEFVLSSSIVPKTLNLVSYLLSSAGM